MFGEFALDLCWTTVLAHSLTYGDRRESLHPREPQDGGEIHLTIFGPLYLGKL